MTFPQVRMRRLRQNEQLRSLVRETKITLDDLVYPLFVCPGTNVKNAISSMPQVYQMSIDQIVKECREVKALGIQAVILFGIPEYKDESATGAYAADGIIQEAVRAIKQNVSGLLVITDVCLCEYTSHGHCGVIKTKDSEKQVDNDATLELLACQALSHAQAGSDMVAPSDMMDGRIGFIRKRLDEAGYRELPIMAYSAKYASAFYGPFREAAQSAPAWGDRKTYQMDPANAREALREVALDLEEGADIVMIKPALAYLDIIYRIKEQFQAPVAAYAVSGEYACLKAAGRLGLLDEEKAFLEVLYAIKRAGADIIITYYAKQAAQLLA